MGAPFAVSSGTEEISGAGTIYDFALFAGRQEVWAVSESEILVHELGGVTRSLANVTDARLLAVAPDESAVYVADGRMLHRIDAVSRTIAQTIDVGAPIDLLEYSGRGLLVGSSVGSQMVLQLRRPADIAMRDAESTLTRLGAIVEIPNGTVSRAFLAAPVDVGGDLTVLTSSLAATSGAPITERSPRAFFTIGTQTIGFLADCSERSTERHCFFEIDLPSGSIRRTGVPDIGAISDAAYDATRNWMVFAGPAGLGVVDRASFRPLVQAQIEIGGIGLLEIFGSNLYGLSDTGFIQRFTIQ
jgi:hypothetical protein